MTVMRSMRKLSSLKTVGTTQSSSTIPYTATGPQKSDSVVKSPPSSLYNEQTPRFGRHSDAKSPKTTSGYDYHKDTQAGAEHHNEWDSQTFNSWNATDIPFTTQRPENSTKNFSSLQYHANTFSSSHPPYTIRPQKLDSSTVTSSSLQYDGYSFSSTHLSPTINPEKLDSSNTTSSSFYDDYASGSSHPSHTVSPQKLDSSTATSSSLYDGYPSSSSHPSHTITPQKLDSSTPYSSSLQYDEYTAGSGHSKYTEDPNMYTTTEYSSYDNSPFPGEEPQYASSTDATLVRRPKKDERSARKREGKSHSEKLRREENDKSRR